MAAEASRSSSTSLSADSYIGSLISLISKSEIRYEGVLFNINTSEASIGLRNVRSFGTEGRKQDGPQLPPSDKVYEYILFRGSDIKDLQVKSSPPVQNTAPIYNDPAIIQSHFPHDAATSTSLPYTGTRSQQDPSSYTSQVGLPKSTAESSVPLYQPSGSLGSWGSWHPSSTPNDSRLPMPMYSQGFYGPSDGLQTQQQPLLQPPPGLWMPPSMQQTQYPAMSASLPSRVFGLPTSPLLNIPPPLMPSFSSGTLNSQSSLLPFQSSAVHSNSSTASVSNIAPVQAPHPAAMSTTSLPLVTPPTTVLDKSDFLTAGAVQPKTDNSMISYNSGLESEHSLAGTSESFPNKGLAPSLVTPNQFLQSGPTVGFSSQSSQSVQNDIVVVQVSSTDLEQPLQTLPESKGPILPLTAPVDHKVHGDPSHSHNNNRGRGRGRGHWASDNVTSFTDDFDFDAMNEKFNKDEVWGHLGKTNTTREDGYSQDEDDAGTSNFETKPVYVKDDFFDSLSSNSSGRSRNGRTKFFEQMKVDTRTFGNFGRHQFGRGSHVYSGQGFDGGGRGYDRGGRGYDRGGSEYSRGGRGFGRSGQLRGAHYGRSYGYNERGGWGYQAT